MPNTLYRVTCDMVMYGQQMQNVLHFSDPSSDPARMETLATEVADIFIQQIHWQVTASVVWKRVRVIMLESQFAGFEKTVNIPGNWGGDTFVTTFAAYIVRIRTAIGGKKGRGRIYVPGILHGFTDGGFVRAEHITTWNQRFEVIKGQFGPGGTSTARLGVCSHKPPFDFKEMTNLQIAPTLGVQRRRNIGVGL